MDKPKPAHTIRFGRIKATIWSNASPSGTWYNVQVCRVYKEGDEWRQSDSFGRDDLPLVCKVLDRAHTWIYEQSKSAKNGQEAGSTAGQAVADPIDMASVQSV